MLQPWITVRVDKKRREATDVYSFELVDPAGDNLPPFTAGSHIDVEVAPGLIRQYSLCNAPGARDRYQIGVLREPASRGGSAGLIDRVSEGDQLRISGPRNHFELHPAAAHSVLIAGGIGITPLLCMAERLDHLGQPFDLHYAVRTIDRCAFRQRIERSRFATACHLHIDDGPELQRLNLKAILSRPAPDTHLYVCGPGGLIEAVLAEAAAQGWAPANVRREFFTPPAAPPAAAPGGFQVKLASTGAILDVPPEKPITAVLAEYGVEIPTSCEQGVCGSCLTGVLAGEPDHRDYFLTPEEQARNDRMTLCCSRARSGILILDL